MALLWHSADDRPRTEGAGRSTRHSFSFGAHYDPANLGYGGLIAHNDDHLAPGAGYPDHPHIDVEIVTWVVSGVLRHRDDSGDAADLGAGVLQVQSAGSGIRHSETADVSSGPTRFVQAWVRPDEAGVPPSRTLVAAGAALASGELVPLADGSGSGLAPLGAKGATLWVARLAPGDGLSLPDGPLQHVFVTSGAVEVVGRTLAEGDAVRVTDEPGHRVTAGAASELMAWTFRE